MGMIGVSPELLRTRILPDRNTSEGWQTAPVTSYDPVIVRQGKVFYES
ncbi:hypothetical protein J0895_23425 [Phormidium pseudopriestleyi FRX01]|uniref:Uncharacterized protein n=1 Tax=Phormidium pseudopriestleyi FRX01 TaxID=1759528 RepID=A0ABS3FXW2_9CYAN|nr:hypothetical protein [Phormidium pseudopriestleyi]MBO0351978.1 hypothetical protein [Phormidium pseudopriestleyi FRX01]